MTVVRYIMDCLRSLMAFCLGPIGGTALFAAMTGALFAYFSWFGVTMAGIVGLLVSSRLHQGEDGADGGHGMASFGLHLRNQELRRKESWEEKVARSAETEERQQSLGLFNTTSAAMIVCGLVMFVATNL